MVRVRRKKHIWHTTSSSSSRPNNYYIKFYSGKSPSAGVAAAVDADVCVTILNAFALRQYDLYCIACCTHTHTHVRACVRRLGRRRRGVAFFCDWARFFLDLVSKREYTHGPFVLLLLFIHVCTYPKCVYKIREI